MFIFIKNIKFILFYIYALIKTYEKILISE